MNRTRLFLSVCSLLLIVLTVNLSAQEEGSGLVFTGCPPYVEGNHCDSMFYQVVAIDIGTGKKCPEAKYFIVSGPGEINERTGLWVFHPEKENLPPYYQDIAEIAAYHGNDTTTADENCRFDVRVHDLYPTFEGYCGAHITVLPGESIEVPLKVTDADPCHTPEFESVQIVPEPSGLFMFDSTGLTITFAPDLADAGQTFEVTISVVSGPMTIGCGLYLDVFEPEPIRFRIATETENDVEPGDTVRVDVLVDAAPVDMDRLDLLLKYDSDLMSFIGAVPGTPFFSPDSGCGWPYFDCRAVYGCGTASGQSIILRARATDRGSPAPPICYRPDQFPAVLATLDFVITDNLMAGEQFAPIDFYWCSCTSNVMIAPAKNPLFMPLAVFTPDGELIPPDDIPGPSGASDDCYFHGLKNVERIRQIEFQNGGVRIGVPALPGAYSVRLGILDDQPQGQFSDVPIMLEEIDSTQGLGGFDLLLGYDASALVFQLAYEGDLYDSCGWEYFTYRFGAHGECGNACPSGMLRVIGLAETNNGPYHPGCQFPSPGYVQREQLPITLAVLRFLVSHDRTLEGQFVPVRFFWYDCGDNVLSNHDGREAFVSADVFDYNDRLISADAEFPTYLGVQDNCLLSSPEGVPTRRVDYHNGGVQIHHPEPVDVRGDINWNGIPWEIADLMLFQQYLWSGWVHLDLATRARLTQSADINQDGYPLTLADARLFIMIITGEASPDTVIEASAGRARVTQDKNLKELSFVTTEPVEWIMLYFSGDVMIDSTALPQGSSVKLFVYASHTSARFACGAGLDQSAGWSLTYFGDGELLDAHAVNTSYQHVVTDVAQVNPPSPYGVVIGKLPDRFPGQFADVPVTLHSFDHSQGMGGFDFLIGYDASALAFQQVMEGELLDACEWEYFTYRFEAPDPCGDACPSGTVRIVGIAETNNGDIHPGCDVGHPGYVDSAPIDLASLRFLVSDDRSLQCQYVPIRFFWTDCGDNVIANHDGREAYLSSNVYEFYRYGEPFSGGEITGTYDFPTFVGSQATLLAEGCYQAGGQTSDPALPNIRFQNGGIDIICDYPDDRGDINLNAISWEIADAVMFSDYFVEGLSAFGSHWEGSIAASDCNADGIALGVADFVYLIRVVVGDAPPYPPSPPIVPSPNPAYFNWDQANSTVSVTTPDSLGAVYLVVEGEITPTLLADHMDMKFGWDTGWTRILIYTYEPNEFISSGPLVSVEGSTGLISVETATYESRPVISVIGGLSEPAPYSVRLGFIEDQIQGHFAEIPVGLETMSDSNGLGGFDFLIGYDASALTFQMANEGSILDSCGWEYFTYRAGPNIPCEGACPSGLVRVVAVAEINNGPMYAGCDDPLPGYVQPDQLPGTLATLNFLVSNDQTLECQVVPLRFFWIDCGDNSLANFDGQELFVSASVFDMDGSRIDAPAEFPTFRGAQEECVFSGQTTGMSAVRWVDYYNGGVAIMCADPIDIRGDINLNAIPFEIADAVMFSYYFIAGLAAFGSHVEGSIDASDCNADGITLTVSDLVYLIRVTNGELSPTPVPGGTCPGVALKANSQEIRVSTDDSLGAVYLIVSGHVTPTLLAPGMEMIYAYHEGYTRVLIYSHEAGHFISDGPLVSFNGEWNLVSIELSSYTGLPCVGGYPTSIDDIESGDMPAEFALHANYPNPFNPNTTIEYDLPEQASVEIVVYNITGQRVQTLVDGVIGAGRHTTFWDGTDAGGRHVSSGIYFYRITAGNYTQARKMLLLK